MWCLYLPTSWNYPGLFSSGRVNFITVNLGQIPSYTMQIPRNLMQTCAQYLIMFWCGCCLSDICVCVLLSSNISLHGILSICTSQLVVYNFPALSETRLPCLVERWQRWIGLCLCNNCSPLCVPYDMSYVILWWKHGCGTWRIHLW